MSFTQQGLQFTPALPPGWGPVSLTGLPYRNMTLDITLTGAGNSIQSVAVDGHPQQRLIPATGNGHHKVQITLGSR
jgi:cellobiose phosphorylase